MAVHVLDADALPDLEPVPALETVPEVELVDRRWRTELVLRVRGVDLHQRLQAVQATFSELVEAVERAASRFRPDSDLAAANAAPGSWVPVSPLLEGLVRVALAAAEATDGLVNPCLGACVDAAGYRTWAAAEVPPALVDTGRAAGACLPDAWQRVELARGRLRVPEGTELDLGATAKAWLADELAERVAGGTGLDVVANMGGDLRAIGASAAWVVGADHAVPGPQPPPMEVHDAGLATSGQGHRRWMTARGPAHHLVDPRTGRSAVTRWWAVSVLAASATSANTAATAGMLLDGAAPRWLQERGLDAALSAWLGAGPVTRSMVGRWPAVEGG
jgi:thiamine biosynthesis lipoprotein